MRTNIDFAPFYRFGIGFDRLFDRLESADRNNGSGSWPSYDIERASEEDYRISMAVPGFRREDLEITQQGNTLVIIGRHQSETKTDYLYRGIDSRSFTRRFDLADYVEVSGAALVDGILTVDLKRELPEAMKPRRISIGSASELQSQKQIEARAA